MAQGGQLDIARHLAGADQLVHAKGQGQQPGNPRHPPGLRDRISWRSLAAASSPTVEMNAAFDCEVRSHMLASSSCLVSISTTIANPAGFRVRVMLPLPPSYSTR